MRALPRSIPETSTSGLVKQLCTHLRWTHVELSTWTMWPPSHSRLPSVKSPLLLKQFCSWNKEAWFWVYKMHLKRSGRWFYWTFHFFISLLRPANLAAPKAAARRNLHIVAHWALYVDLMRQPAISRYASGILTEAGWIYIFMRQNCLNLHTYTHIYTFCCCGGFF